MQIGNAIADLLAKCGYGLMIYAIARAKSEVDQQEMEKVPILAPLAMPLTKMMAQTEAILA